MAALPGGVRVGEPPVIDAEEDTYLRAALVEMLREAGD